MKIETDNGLVDNMVTYINNKYPNDEFYYSGPFGGGAGATYKTIIVSSKKFPDGQIYVRYSNENGEFFSDNYLAVLYAEQTETLIKSTIETALNSEVVLFYQPNAYACPNDDSIISFDEYIKNEDSCIGFTAIANYDVLDKTVVSEKIKQAFTDGGLCCFGTIYFESDLNEVNSITNENLEGYIFEKSYNNRYDFKLDSKANLLEASWGDA